MGDMRARRRLAAGAVLALVLALPAVVAAAADAAIAVSHAWTRPTPGTMTPAAGYMVLENQGPAGDRLLSASSPAAEAVTLHRTEIDAGVARMRPLADGLAIPAHGTARLEPGGLHLMLSGLRQPLALGQSAPLTLTFAQARAVAVELKVEKPAPAGGDHGGHGGAMHQGTSPP